MIEEQFRARCIWRSREQHTHYVEAYSVNAKMFEDEADKIFAKAGVPIAGNEDLHYQVTQILSAKMAQLSATLGLSYTRQEKWEEQKQSLVQDLQRMFGKS